MKEKIVKMNYVKFNKAHPELLLGFAQYILSSITAKGQEYDEKKYGSVKNMKRWSKPKLIRWLLQFNIELKAPKK